ncbi:MAG: penicillin-binding protein activator [Gammaproteobacteria bacterium]|nr:penicillin-binding protein activator [Gammaproteobacteria bacterium]
MKPLTSNYLLIVIMLTLAACASQPSRDSVQEKKVVSQKDDVQSLLVAAERTSSPESETLKLKAMAILLSRQDLSQAELVLSTIREPNLTTQQRIKFIRFQAELALARDLPKDALNWLSSEHIPESEISREDQISLSLLRATAYYAARSFLASGTELIYIDNLLDSQQRLLNHENIWNALTELPEDTLTRLATMAVTSDMRGWLSLAALAKKYRDDPTTQLQELSKWRQIWSYHPATKLLPSSLMLLDNIVRNQPGQIALLLPLRGELAAYGNAIRDGFLAAHYQNKSRNDSLPRITIYDSSPADIGNVYQQAINEGAEFVVGPLDKNKVAELNKLPELAVPILALNRASAKKSAPQGIARNIYQFSLSPEDEVVQVAKQAWQEGLRRALVIVPDDEWGMRNGTIFMDTWSSLGGDIADVTFFSTSRDYSEMVQSLLQVDASEKRASDLRRTIRERFEFNPRRRRDIDFIFLLANPNQARGINPTLAFFYAEDLPVYATSHINSGSDSRLDSIDLNGIRFCDIPWKLTESGPLFQSIQQNWQASRGSLAPFYALGVDAYHLYPRLNQLEQIPGDKLFGMTGVLTLNNNRVIVRRLTWAQIKNGKVRAIPMVIDQLPVSTQRQDF